MSNERGCQCGQAHGACTTEFQYAVKLVCGVVAGAPAGGTGAPTPVAPGRYWTAINIHNPDKCHDAHFRWKVVVAAPLGQPPAVPKYRRQRVLGPDLALEIDCTQVMQTFPAPIPPFVKGYVVIESDIELDVVAVYSGTQGGNALLSSFHTERVQPRCVPVCEDLVLPLHTGFASWQTVSPTVGPLGSAVPVTQLAWVAAPFGSKWVSQTGTDGTNASSGTRYYELSFDLCFGYEVPAAFQIQVVVDDTAKVLLNNNTIPPTVLWNTLTTLNVNPAFLQAGRNRLRVEVTNKTFPPPPPPNPTGFALAGILRVIRGKCPCSPLPIAPPPPVITTPGDPIDNAQATSSAKTVAKRRKKRGS